MFVNEKNVLKKLLSKDEFKKCEDVVNGTADLFEEKALLEKLVEIYSTGEFAGTMPTDVAKARSEVPDEWLLERLWKVFKNE